jgi:hypothetical protein
MNAPERKHAAGKLVRSSVTAVTLAILICLPGCFGFSNGNGIFPYDALFPPPNIAPAQPNVVSLNPQDWYIFYSAGMPDHPSSNVQGVWSFPFPTAGHVNYIQTPFNATTVPHSVHLTFRVDGDAPQYKVIDPNDIPPATVHIFFEQRNDNLSSPNGRWWADTSGYNLGSRDNQTITIIVPFDPSQWSNVFDDAYDPAAFYAALGNVGWIGVTCGGQYFWGHGVALSSGAASYVLVDFHIE